MKLYVLLLVLLVAIVVGCTSSTCPNDCDDGNVCTTNQCVQGECFVVGLAPDCCGDHLCESGELGVCAADCGNVTGDDCTNYHYFNDSDTFKAFDHHLPACVDGQLLFCTDRDSFNSPSSSLNQAYCLIDMALSYGDVGYCDYISNNVKKYDASWYCKALVKHDRSYCSYIDSDSWLEVCLKATGHA